MQHFRKISPLLRIDAVSTCANKSFTLNLQTGLTLSLIESAVFSSGSPLTGDRKHY